MKESNTSLLQCARALQMGERNLHLILKNPFRLNVTQTMILAQLFKVEPALITHLIINCTTTTEEASKWYLDHIKVPDGFEKL